METINGDVVSTTELIHYQKWIIPEAHPLLADTNVQLLGIKASLQHQTVGFILAEINPLFKTAKMHSIFVEESYRKQGIGTFLMQSLQTYLIKKEKSRALTFVYEQSDFFAKALEKIIQHLGWVAPRLFLIKCYFDMTQFYPDWYAREIEKGFPYKEVKFFSWKELRDNERKEVEFQAEQGRFLPFISPLKEESKIEHSNSLGLRFKNKLIGWCITKRISDDTLRYASLYVDKQFRFRGYAIWLLANSIKKQKESPIPIAEFELNLKEVDPTWRSFVYKRLIPHAQKVEKFKLAVQAF